MFHVPPRPKGIDETLKMVKTGPTPEQRLDRARATNRILLVGIAFLLAQFFILFWFRGEGKAAECFCFDETPEDGEGLSDRSGLEGAGNSTAVPPQPGVAGIKHPSNSPWAYHTVRLDGFLGGAQLVPIGGVPLLMTHLREQSLTRRLVRRAMWLWEAFEDRPFGAGKPQPSEKGLKEETKNQRFHSWQKEQWNTDPSERDDSYSEALHSAEIRKLRNLILQVMKGYFPLVGISAEESNAILARRNVILWASVHYNNSLHEEHAHAGSLVSGVFYVTPKGGGGKYSLMLRDPRGGASREFGARVKVRPRWGDLAIFPGWVRHSVDQESSHEGSKSQQKHSKNDPFGGYWEGSGRIAWSFSIPGDWTATVTPVSPLYHRFLQSSEGGPGRFSVFPSV